MAEKSAESYVSLKGNDKAISIFLHHNIKVMVILEKGQWLIEPRQNLMCYLKVFLLFKVHVIKSISLGRNSGRKIANPEYVAIEPSRNLTNRAMQEVDVYITY